MIILSNYFCICSSLTFSKILFNLTRAYAKLLKMYRKSSQIRWDEFSGVKYMAYLLLALIVSCVCCSLVHLLVRSAINRRLYHFHRVGGLFWVYILSSSCWESRLLKSSMNLC